MKLAFYIAAAGMIAVALALLLIPLLRHGRHAGPSRAIFGVILLIALILPLGSAGLYMLVGAPGVLRDPTVNSANAMPDSGSTAGASNAPDMPNQRTIQQWMEIAHAYDTQERHADARDAYARVLKIDAVNTVAMVGWVEADMSLHADYSIDAPSRELLKQAIALEPDNQRALWLIGLSDFQQQNYAQASTTWRHLLQLLDANSTLARSVAQQIVVAEAQEKLTHNVAGQLR